MNTPYEIDQSDNRIVYVKTVDVTDLPQDVRAEAGELEHLYAVHSADGQQLALVSDRKTAFVLARQHDYSPVAVH
ncbi:DUF1150 family protein [Microbulbifer sp. S227A]|uniref:DUF1150 family protein n=1 Tax=Microbulbifer sp. S227A TaxID=3415131 RepID=UPI003C7987FD